MSKSTAAASSLQIQPRGKSYKTDLPRAKINELMAEITGSTKDSILPKLTLKQLKFITDNQMLAKHKNFEEIYANVTENKLFEKTPLSKVALRRVFHHFSIRYCGVAKTEDKNPDSLSYSIINSDMSWLKNVVFWKVINEELEIWYFY